MATRAITCARFEPCSTPARPLCLPGPSACELIDHRLVTLARESDPAAAALIPAGAAVVLLVEFESETLHGAATAAADLADRLTRDRHALHAVTATEPEAI